MATKIFIPIERASDFPPLWIVTGRIAFDHRIVGHGVFRDESTALAFAAILLSLPELLAPVPPARVSRSWRRHSAFE